MIKKEHSDMLFFYLLSYEFQLLIAYLNLALRKPH